MPYTLKWPSLQRLCFPRGCCRQPIQSAQQHQRTKPGSGILHDPDAIRLRSRQAPKTILAWVIDTCMFCPFGVAFLLLAARICDGHPSQSSSDSGSPKLKFTYRPSYHVYHNIIYLHFRVLPSSLSAKAALQTAFTSSTAMTLILCVTFGSILDLKATIEHNSLVSGCIRDSAFRQDKPSVLSVPTRRQRHPRPGRLYMEAGHDNSRFLLKE